MAGEEQDFKVTDRRGHSDASFGATPSSSPGADQSGLGALFMMFASSALVSLGEVTHPETNERTLDVDQAKGAIDMLLMLRDKTQGNRTEGESRLLEDILYDLQMRFVKAARRRQPEEA